MAQPGNTPFDPNAVARMVTTGAVPPDVPFAPARQDSPVFEITDENSANWVVRKIIESRAYAERVEEYARREMRRCERDENFLLTHYGPQLEGWARRELAERGDRLKHVRLPAGSVGFRTAPGGMIVQDDDALLDWCKKNLPEAVVTVERVSISTVREHLQQTGECPDGAEIIPPRERFFVK